MKKKYLWLLVAVVTMLTIVACGKKGASGEGEVDTKNQMESEDGAEVETTDDIESDHEESNDENDYEPSISIDNIDWKVEETTIDGEKVISFGYTNNTNYTIADIEMKFVQKDDVTSEQRAVFDVLKGENSLWTDEDIEEMYILGYNRKLADPGETVKDSPCTINGTYTLVTSMEQYDIMRPDTASIACIGDDGKLYMLYYDFNTEEFGSSTQGGQEIQEWSDSEISSLMPKPESRIIKVSSDDDDYFFFYAYGVSRGEYDDYVTQCTDLGFTDVQFEGNDGYRALNSDGYEIDITYDAIEECMTGNIEKEETEDESQSNEGTETESATDEATESVNDSSINPEFKEALDSYEAFMDEYIAFMETYQNSDDVTSMLSEYADYMSKYTDLMAKIDAIDQNNLTTAELEYYVEVTTRVSQKLLSVAGTE